MNPILKIFNSKLQTLSQSGSRQLLLSAKEARDLQSEIFNILAQVSYLEAQLRQKSPESTADVTSINADGGKF